MNQEEAIDALVRQLNGELPAEEQRELKAYLEDHPSFAEEVRELRDAWEDLGMLDEKLKKIAERELKPMSDSLREKLNEKAEGEDLKVVQPEESSGGEDTDVVPSVDKPKRKTKPRRSTARSRRTSSRSSGRWVMGGLAAAALLLVAVLAGYNPLSLFQEGSDQVRNDAPEWIATVEQSDAGLEVLRDGRPVRVDRKMKLYPDDQVRVSPDGSDVHLRYRNLNVDLFLSESTEVQFGSESNPRRIHLETGTIRGRMEKEEGQTFVLTTMQARAEIVGTKFRLTADRTTRLEVTEGRVRFEARHRDESVFVAQGEYAEIGPDSPLAHGRIDEPEEESDKPKQEKKQPVGDASTEEAPDEEEQQQDPFVMGVNFNGGDVTIDGREWLAEDVAENVGLSVPDDVERDTVSRTPTPRPDPDTLSMLRTNLWQAGDDLTFSVKLDDGTYRVNFWIFENYDTGYRQFDILLEDVVKEKNVIDIGNNEWKVSGPHRVTVEDGRLDVLFRKKKNDPIVQGMTIHRAESSEQSD